MGATSHTAEAKDTLPRAHAACPRTPTKGMCGAAPLGLQAWGKSLKLISLRGRTALGRESLVRSWSQSKESGVWLNIPYKETQD